LSPKCAVIRKPYAPGLKKKRRPPQLSEYGKELREKQKLRNWYNLRENQFGNYVREILKKRGKVEDTASLLMQKLEGRLDNVIFRLGFGGTSRMLARQIVSHNHILVNGRLVNTPAYQVKKGDKIGIRVGSRQKKIFADLAAKIKKYPVPAWLKLDADKLEAEVIQRPVIEGAMPPVEISTIFEHYSR
jgi:small subunit ribosomal protein S4